ncbi:VCBS repeat-containing protein [Candidatus Acetothermia bacterium]|nr:VCBS repeat-containing protein [Candidatus Acetothermia bacterium]
MIKWLLIGLGVIAGVLIVISVSGALGGTNAPVIASDAIVSSDIGAQDKSSVAQEAMTATPQEMSATAPLAPSVSVSASVKTPTFSAPMEFPVGERIEMIAAADFNNDKKADVAAVRDTSNMLSLLLGDGSGKLGSPLNVDLSPNPISLAVADFNGDKNADIFVALSGNNTYHVLLGDGTGHFKKNDYRLRDSESVVAADFNGDSKQDIALLTRVATVRVLLGNGDGTFTSKDSKDVKSTMCDSPKALATGDLNKDGRADLIVANCGSEISVLLGNGDGTFEPAVGYSAGTTASGLVGVAVGDFNKDGKLDVLKWHQKDGLIYLLLGDGTGKLGVAAFFEVRAGCCNLKDVAIGDFNSDGNLDVVSSGPAGRSSEEIAIFLGDGTGKFSAPVLMNAGFPGVIGPNYIAVGDFNNDSRTDIALGCNAGTMNGVKVCTNSIILLLNTTK